MRAFFRWRSWALSPYTLVLRTMNGPTLNIRKGRKVDDTENTKFTPTSQMVMSWILSRQALRWDLLLSYWMEGYRLQITRIAEPGRRRQKRKPVRLTYSGWGRRWRKERRNSRNWKPRNGNSLDSQVWTIKGKVYFRYPTHSSRTPTMNYARLEKMQNYFTNFRFFCKKMTEIYVSKWYISPQNCKYFPPKVKISQEWDYQIPHFFHEWNYVHHFSDVFYSMRYLMNKWD